MCVSGPEDWCASLDTRLSPYRLLMADVYELAGASRDTSEQIAGELGQTAARWHVMSGVSQDALSVPAIARRLGLTRQSVQRVVNELVDAGLVTLEENPDHQRSPLVRLTSAGHDVLEELFRRSDATRAALLDRSGLSATELDQARQVVRSLLAAFDA